MDKITEGFILIAEGVGEVFSLVVKQVTALAESIWVAMSKDQEIAKYQMIYKRTKKNRIKKKQLSKIKQRMSELNKG